MDKQNAKKGLHKIKDVAQEASVSPRTIHRAIQDGKIRTVRLSGAVRIPESERLRILQRGF